MLLLAILVFLFILWNFYTKAFGSEYYPASRKVIKKAMELLKPTRQDVFYDLGCGDGRVVIEASKYCKKVIGIEIDFLRYLIALTKIKLLGIKNAEIIRKNFMNTDIKNATIIFLFLTKKGNEMLKQRLKKTRARIVSHWWKFSGWEPFMKDERYKLYFYKP